MHSIKELAAMKKALTLQLETMNKTIDSLIKEKEFINICINRINLTSEAFKSKKEEQNEKEN